MEIAFIRQMMLAKLEEFLHFNRVYQESTANQLEFLRSHLHAPMKREYEQFILERPDLEQWAEDMIQEINVRTQMLQGYYQHALENYIDEEKDRNLVITYEGVPVIRHVLPHGTVVISWGYNPDHQVLDVEYNSRKVYRYFDVPASVAAAIKDDKAGSSVNRLVKGKYRYFCVKE